ncbi:MAG: TonB-dependent siderophore receptor [Pseudomonadota bacterium]
MLNDEPLLPEPVLLDANTPLIRALSEHNQSALLSSLTRKVGCGAARDLMCPALAAAVFGAFMIGAGATGSPAKAAPNDTGTQTDVNGALPTIDVTANQQGTGAGGPPMSPSEQAGYSAPPVQQSSTKLNVPTFDLPIAVQTVPDQVMKDQNTINPTEALQNVSGVQTYTPLQSDQAINIRGFDSTNTYRNGLKMEQPVIPSLDSSNLQRIDVLKGPASTIFGRADPGGIVNYVTKTPLDTPYYSIEQQAGSFNLLRTEWDLTGPVQALDSGAVSYRFSGSYTKDGQFIDFIKNDQTFLAPAVTWKIDPATTLTVDAEYQHRNEQRFVGIPAVGMYPADLPVYRSFDEPNQPPSTYRTSLIAEELKHEFNEDWAITSRFLAVRSTHEQLDLNASSFPDPPILDRPILFQFQTATNYSTNLDLTGKFDVLGAKNEVLMGADYYYLHDDTTLSTIGNYPINIYNPVYGTVPASAWNSAAYQTYTGQASYAFFEVHSEDDLGVYAQDVVTPFEGLHILAGIRYDLADVHDGESNGYNPNQAYTLYGTNPDQRSQFPSPRFGIVYQPVPWIGFYGSYTKSFGLYNGIDTNSTPLRPQVSEGWEGGVKTELLDKRLTATLAFYDITKSNVLTPAPTAANPYAVNTVDARSQGVELDVLGKLTDELSVIGSYSHIDAKIIEDTSGLLLGHSLHVYAPDSGSVFLTCDFASGSILRGWSTGGGVFAASNRWGDDRNTFILPAYARLDSFVRYQTIVGGSRVSTQINVYNIADTKYYTGVSFFGAQTGIIAGTPRSVVGSLRVEF